jgi:opacity protein-like surface antigen
VRKLVLLAVAGGFVVSTDQTADAADAKRVLKAPLPRVDVPARPVLKAPPPAAISPWQVEFGARYWYSDGKLKAPNPLNGFENTIFSNLLLSRIIYSDLTGHSGEAFGRVDHASGFFLKGFAGAGLNNSGKVNDEDFPFGAVGNYSNTLSQQTDGNFQYAVFDVGFNLLTSGDGSKLGPFVGYSYFREKANAVGCPQLAANAQVGGCPLNTDALREIDQYNSVRVGLSGQFMLTDRLKLTGDVAWIPFTDFNGRDDHPLRHLVVDEWGSKGDGVQAEAILSYKVLPNFSVGAGGRLWWLTSKDASVRFDFLPGPPDPRTQLARFSAERYGAFVQASYLFGAPSAWAASDAIYKAPPTAPVSWTGIYIGGHLGAAWGNQSWSDPFPSFNTFSCDGNICFGGPDVPGFGDRINLLGPLAGGQVGINWQSGRWVVGLEADASGADILGENTCFTGMGGGNCSSRINATGTIASRLGFAWDRAMVYAKAGGAWARNEDTVNINNITLLSFAGPFPGVSTVTHTRWGWTAGIGVEYAFGPAWSAKLEYDYLDFGHTSETFPVLFTPLYFAPSATPISIGQQLHELKFGVNYRFDIGWLLRGH